MKILNTMPTETQKPAATSGSPCSLIDAIREIERRDFRTNEDSGAHPNAMLLMNRLRKMVGLPEITKRDLPASNGKTYVMPPDSKLLANARPPGDPASDSTGSASLSGSPSPCSSWIARGEQDPPADSVRILVFSPCYPKGHEMRYRILDARFFKTAAEATHFLILEPNDRTRVPDQTASEP